MTPTDMKFLWKLKFDSLFDFGSPSYDDRQIGELLTDAQFRVFIHKYNPFGNKYQRGFEQNEKRRRDLDQLIKPASMSGGTITQSTDQTGVHPNGVLLDLPDDFLYFIEESAVISITPNEEVDVTPVRHDEYREAIRDPFKRPYENKVWRMDFSKETDPTGDGIGPNSGTDKRVELITGRHRRTGTQGTVTDYRVRYLRMPPDIVVNEVTPSEERHCVLDESIHREIVDEAVKIAAAAVKPQELQIKQSEKNDSE